MPVRRKAATASPLLPRGVRDFPVLRIESNRIEETHGNSEKEDDIGLNDGDDCLDDFSGGQSECFDPGGGDGERVSDAVFEDLDGQGVRTECLNHESCEEVGASIPALPRPDGGSLECTDPPGPCQPPEAVPEWPMDFDDIALCVNDLDETGIRMTGMTRAFATKFQKGPPRSATKKKAVRKAEHKAKAMIMHDGTAPDQREECVQFLLAAETASKLHDTWGGTLSPEKAKQASDMWENHAATLERSMAFLHAGIGEPAMAEALVCGMCECMLDIWRVTLGSDGTALP
jgi:hypothetical protein